MTFWDFANAHFFGLSCLFVLVLIVVDNTIVNRVRARILRDHLPKR